MVIEVMRNGMMHKYAESPEEYAELVGGVDIAVTGRIAKQMVEHQKKRAAEQLEGDVPVRPQEDGAEFANLARALAC